MLIITNSINGYFPNFAEIITYYEALFILITS